MRFKGIEIFWVCFVLFLVTLLKGHSHMRFGDKSFRAGQRQVFFQ